MALLLRSRKTRPNSLLHHRLFSTSNSGNDDPPRNNSAFYSFLKQSKTNPNQPSPSDKPSSQSNLEEIQRNLAKFRSITAAPPSSEPPSLEEIYTRKVTQNETESTGNVGNSRPKTFSFSAITQKLRKSAASKGRDLMSSPILRKSPLDSTVDGGTSAFPGSILGRDMWARKRDGISSDSIRTEFLRLYGVEELGEKLKSLRPQGKGNKWFSIAELNERLTMLRELEEKESQSNIKGVGLHPKDLKDCLLKIAENKEKSSLSKAHDIFSQLGGTPTYMQMPPQEHLVEKYFHPDNMSSAEKLKIELAKVREEFKMSESDCGSARVQVAQLTTKIKHLSAVLHKKDKHSRKGLLAMVQKRKSLLKYLRRTDWDSYCFVISKLGLRDNPEHSYRGRTGSKVAA